MDRAWMQRAACAGMSLDLFFGPDREREPARKAREAEAAPVCQVCPVRTECLGYAVARPEKYGIWGGMNEENRAAERRRRLRRDTHRARQGRAA